MARFVQRWWKAAGRYSLSSIDPCTNRTYVANALNQYTQISNLCDSASLREEFLPQFDDDGNQTLIKTSTGTWSVTYNGENRPVRWERVLDASGGEPASTLAIAMSFDRMGRRVEYLETESTEEEIEDNGVTNLVVTVATNAHHRFVYDGYLCIQRLNAASNNAIDLAFGWDPSEPVATRPMIMQKYGEYTLFYTHDGNKNVSDLVFFQRANGIAAHYEYAPFGAVTATSSSTPVTAYDFRTLNPFRFSSEYNDTSIGMCYFNSRHYEPFLSRWTVRDIVEEFGGLNLYCFLSNCIQYSDILGMLSSKHNSGDAVECSRENVGAVRANSETSFSPGTYNPDDLDNDLRTIMTILVLYDVPIPKIANSSDIVTGNVPGLPKGSDVAAEILKNFKRLKKLAGRDGRYKIWTKVQCQKCECKKGMLSLVGLSETTYSWKTLETSDWIPCDIGSTKWGKKANRRRDRTINNDGSLNRYLLSSRDVESILTQCKKQAEEFCDDYK